jgi:hypothetical protein
LQIISAGILNISDCKFLIHKAKVEKEGRSHDSFCFLSEKIVYFDLGMAKYSKCSDFLLLFLMVIALPLPD